MDEAFERVKRAPIPVERLKDPQARKLIQEAGIVWGLDTATGKTSLFYGKEMLEDVRKARALEWGPQKVVMFSLDFRTDALEFLCAAVEVLKGSHCYNR